MKSVFTYILSIVIVLLLSGCSSDNGAEQKTDYKDTIVVAITPTLDCFPMVVAKETGIADSLGHCLKLQYHLSKADCDTAIVGGSVCALFTDSVRAANINKKGLKMYPHDNLQLFFFTNYKARLNEAKQLTDKMIALDRQSVEALVAQHVLDSVKLTGDKTFMVEMLNFKTRENMIMSNIMDAVILPEPYASVVRKAGHKKIYSTKQYGNKTIGRLVSSNNEKTIKELYNLACQNINKKGLHAYDSILVKRYYVPAKNVKDIPEYKFSLIK